MLSGRVGAAVLASIFMLASLTGCAAAEDVDTSPETASPEVTETPEETTAESNTTDRTEGVDNDPGVISALYSIAETTCEKALAEGVTEAAGVVDQYAVLLPSEKHQSGFVGYYVSYGEFYPESSPASFASCALQELMDVSEEAYGEKLAHIQITDLGDDRYLFEDFWMETAEINALEVVDGAITSIALIDPETDEEVIKSTLTFGIADEAEQPLLDYLATATEGAN